MKWTHADKWVLAVVLAGAFFSTAAGYFNERGGYSFNGLASPLDGNTYASFYNQARDGHLLFTNEFTPEKVPYVMFRPVYLLMGLTLGVLRFPYASAYHLFRFFLIVAFFYAAKKLVGEVTGNRTERTIALVLIFFSSGAGYILRFLEIAGIKRIGSSDLWLPEGITFLALNSHPHLIASVTLMVYASYWIIKALKSRENNTCWRNASLTMLVLGFTHLFDDITLYVAIAVSLVLMFLSGGRPLRVFIRRHRRIIWLALPGIAFLYTAYLFLGIPAFSSWNSQNSLEAPKFYYFVFGYAFLLVFIFAGWLSAGRIKKIVSDRAFLFLSAWIFSAFILVYSPFNIQRRFVEGVHVPLSILAATGLAEIKDALSRTWGRRAAAAVVFLLILVTVPSNVLWLYHSVPSGNELTTAPPWRVPLYLTKGELQALKWFRTADGNPVVITDYGLGNYLPRYAHARPYVGHWAQTINFGKRVERINSLLRSTNAELFSSKLQNIKRDAEIASGGTRVYAMIKKQSIPPDYIPEAVKYENEEIIIFTP